MIPEFQGNWQRRTPVRPVPNLEDPATQPVYDDELRQFAGDEIEPLDLNESRAAIKPTTWHTCEWGTPS